MLNISKTAINSISAKELNNGYQYLFNCESTNNVIKVYKEHSLYQIKTVTKDSIIISWDTVCTLPEVKSILKTTHLQTL